MKLCFPPPAPKLLADEDEADESAFSATLNLFTIQEQQALLNIPTSYCALVRRNILHCMKKKMNKHGLGVSHGRGGSFYRLYFITLCHLHGGMLIAGCDYLHIWKSTSICHVPPLSHESAPPTRSNNCCFFTRWQAAAAWRHLAPYILPSDICELHACTSHLAASHPALQPRTQALLKFGDAEHCPCWPNLAQKTNCCWGGIITESSESTRRELFFPISPKGIMRLINYMVI